MELSTTSLLLASQTAQSILHLFGYMFSPILPHKKTLKTDKNNKSPKELLEHG